MDKTEKELRNFLEISYAELEEMNVKAGQKAQSDGEEKLSKEYFDYLKKEDRIKAITICFSDIEGRFHMLDYDKKFFLDSIDNLTFDGSSIKGFSEQFESDLRLEPDWGSLRFLPADIFGAGKVVMFADVLTREKKAYPADFRGQLKELTKKLKSKDGVTAQISAEVEGFLVDGRNAEQNYSEEKGFSLISGGGYFHSLPMDKLKIFIDRSAEAQRALGFKNEKDHPEVAPSQFELNFSYTEALRACDQIQLYKLVCRQVASEMGMTATFLPKPISGINGSGMHLNLSMSKNGQNIFYKKDGEEKLSKIAWDAISRILNHAPEISLALNSSVNAYRRLDPHFEAPNQIKVSSHDRGSMIRIPAGNEKSARIEIRSVAPDSNPYLVALTILKTIAEGKPLSKDAEKRERLRFLPGNVNDAIKLFKGSDFITKILGEEPKEKYLKYKQMSADRCPKELGKTVKTSEIIYHHEVTNQMLWNRF
jgi:glutamine synthetase